MIQAPVGTVFGRLTVVETDLRLPLSPSDKPHWLGKRAVKVRCECGDERVIQVADLARGHTRSCKCLQRERNGGGRNRTHGLSRTPNFIRHKGMMNRCYRVDNVNYDNYGGRGIRVHLDWHDVEVFVTWLDANLGPCPEGFTMDRIDVDGDYEPGNIRWASRSEQYRNRRK